VVTEIQNNTEMAIARLLFTISALISVISLRVVFGGIVCEKLPVEVCAFSVSTSGARCVLEKSIFSDGNVQYECQRSEVIAENLNELIETEECVNACGVERMTVGMSTDSLAERAATTTAPTSSTSTSILPQGKVSTCPACARITEAELGV